MWQKAVGSTLAVAATAADRKRRHSLFIFLAFLLACYGLYSFFRFLNTPPQYVLVIDAGSSGTRMNAYAWEPPSAAGALPTLRAIPPDAAAHKIPRRALENRRAYKRVETEPGLDKFAVDTLDSLGPVALEPLLEWAKAVIPRSLWRNTPLFLLGTAGIRRLRDDDSSKILRQARTVLAASGFRFEAPWARVLSGADEGMFGWISLNSRLNTLGSDATVGALDLGGSSLQVTFAGGGHTADVHAVNVSMLGAQHSLYTQSHHHFGLDDAFERSIDILLQQQDGGSGDISGTGANADAGRRLATSDTSAIQSVQTTDPIRASAASPILTYVHHPCLHAGYRSSHTRLPLDNGPPVPSQVILTGRPDADACATLVSAVVTAPTNCTSPPCALGGLAPQAAGKFIGLSGFYVVAHFFGLTDAYLPNGLLGAVKERGQDFCSLSWSEVERLHPGEMAVETYCFRSYYISLLTTTGLGLTEGQVDVGESTASWTLGAALAEGHRLAGLGNGKATRILGPPYEGGHAESQLPWKFAVLVMLCGAVGCVALTSRRWRGRRPPSSAGDASTPYPEYSSASIGNRSTVNNGSSAALAGDMYRQSFGVPSRSKKTPPGPGDSTWPQELAATGSLAAGASLSTNGEFQSTSAIGRPSMTRSATFSRRLSALESGTTVDR